MSGDKTSLEIKRRFGGGQEMQVDLLLPVHGPASQPCIACYQFSQTETALIPHLKDG